MRAKPITKATKSLRSYKMRTKSPPNEKKAEHEGSMADRSVLRSSIDTSISNLYQLSRLFENGTSELCDLLSNECCIIYECKVCRNLFRSVANFISHKRTYCVTKYVDVQEQLLLNAKGSTITTRTTSRQDIISMLDGIIEKQPDKGLMNNTVVLKEMNSTSEGLINCNKQGPNIEKYATLGPDGRVLDEKEEEEEEQKNKCICTICRELFVTQKSLTRHLQLEHSNSKIFFVCPCCKKYFTNTWSVYRHLYKVHHKSNEQVRKLRAHIKRKQVLLSDLIQTRKSPQKNAEEKPYDQDKAWMEELEGNTELQRCLGCGKRFDRRVALISHSQMCQKRLAVIQKLPKRRPPTPPKPESERRSRIQVRMYYEKVNTGPKKLNEIITTNNSSEMESDFRLPHDNSKPESISEVPINKVGHSPFLPDKDVNDVVSRYRRDVDIHDKCRRLEAKLLQLHKVAVEEIEGNLTDIVPESETSIQECIGTVNANGEENEEKTAEEDTFEPPTFIVSTTSEIPEKTAEVHNVTFVQEEDSQTLENGNCSGISSCMDNDIIVIDDDEEEDDDDDEDEDEDEGEDDDEDEDDDEAPIQSDTEVTYINGDSDKDFALTNEGDVTSTISIPHISLEDSANDSENATDHTSENTVENCDPKSPMSPSGTQHSEKNENHLVTTINSFINRTLKKCMICFRVFHQMVQVRRHVARHLNIFKYGCKFNSCKFKSFLKRDIIKHLEHVHKKKIASHLLLQRLEIDKDKMNLLALLKKRGMLNKGTNGFNISRLPRKHRMNGQSNSINDSDIYYNGMLNKIRSDEEESEGESDEEESIKEMNVEENLTNSCIIANEKTYSDEEEDELYSTNVPLSDDNLKAQMMEIIFGTENQEEDAALPTIHFNDFSQSSLEEYCQDQ